jgi:hypothetical protein
MSLRPPSKTAKATRSSKRAAKARPDALSQTQTKVSSKSLPAFGLTNQFRLPLPLSQSTVATAKNSVLKA